MTDEYRKGGPCDDVANNIRNEMQRDAMPSAEEAQNEARRQLAEEGCKVEGCKEDDPDNLQRQRPHTHSCRQIQHGEVRPEIVCEEHAGDVRKEWLENKKEALDRDDVVALVVYECDITNTVTEDESVDEKMRVPPQHRSQPEVEVACHCGSGIKNIYYADDADGNE